MVFLAHPLAGQIPLWTLWGTYLGFVAVFVAAFLVRRMREDKSNASRLVPTIALIAFASVELDVMVRVFMLTVGGLYKLYPIPVGLLAGIFIAGAFQTPVEAAFCVLASTLVGVPALIVLEKGKILRWPLS